MKKNVSRVLAFMLVFALCFGLVGCNFKGCKKDTKKRPKAKPQANRKRTTKHRQTIIRLLMTPAISTSRPTATLHTRLLLKGL